MSTKDFFVKILNKIFILTNIFVFCFYPILVSAENNKKPQNLNLPNPLAAGKSELIGITNVVGGLVTVLFGVIGIISLIALIIGAYYYLTASGNQERLKKGTETIVWAVIGIIVAFGSYAVLEFIIERLS
jgi:hypothetical protein